MYGYVNVNGRGMTIPVSAHMLAMLDSHGAQRGDYELDMDFDGGGDIGNAIRHASLRIAKQKRMFSKIIVNFLPPDGQLSQIEYD